MVVVVSLGIAGVFIPDSNGFNQQCLVLKLEAIMVPVRLCIQGLLFTVSGCGWLCWALLRVKVVVLVVAVGGDLTRVVA